MNPRARATITTARPLALATLKTGRQGPSPAAAYRPARIFNTNSTPGFHAMISRQPTCVCPQALLHCVQCSAPNTRFICHTQQKGLRIKALGIAPTSPGEPSLTKGHHEDRSSKG
jgi:hypothetical protein